MKDALPSKFVTEVEVADTALGIGGPFQLDQDNQRRFVRLEISAPMSLMRIRDLLGNLRPPEDGRGIPGTVLNVSAGGVLVDLSQPLSEDDLVAMHFSLQGGETLDNVLGSVKRVEQDGPSYLIGIEFIGEDHLRDRLSQAELDLLKVDLGAFARKVEDVLQKYICRSPTPGRKG